MKFLVLSDLHVERSPFTLPADVPAFDAVILAGDILPNAEKLPRWAARPTQFGAEVPIIVVPGNHEYYGGIFQSRRQGMVEAGIPNVHVPAPSEVLLDQGRVRVLGCTLWTDFELPVQTKWGLRSNLKRAMDEARRYMTDYQAIGIRSASGRRRMMLPEDTRAMHLEERAWLLAKLREPFAGSTVVVTHHGPASGSVSPNWAGDWLNPAYVSELPDEFFDVPRLWVHGHGHRSFDYMRNKTRVLTNPRGYRRRDGSFENDLFEPVLVVDLTTDA